MKNTIVLMTLLVLGTAFQAHADEDQVAHSFLCQSTKAEMSIVAYESGVVGWSITEKTTGEQNEFMGFVSGGDNQNLAAEFYSTDLGSDLHVKDGFAKVTLTNMRNTHFKLSCETLK